MLHEKKDPPEPPHFSDGCVAPVCARYYRKVSDNGRGYYSFFHVLRATTIEGRTQYKGAYYNKILLFSPKKRNFVAFLANI